MHDCTIRPTSPLTALLYLVMLSAAFTSAAAANPVRAGQFAAALDARQGGAATLDADDAFALPPITVEAWVRLDNAESFNIIAASEDKGSATHWELYSYAGDGTLAAYMPGYEPAEIRSNAPIADGEWHHVGMAFAADRVRLYVDGEQVAEQAVARQQGGERLRGPLTIGYAHSGGGRIGCAGLIEQVRIRRGVQDVTQPDGLMGVDDDTLGAWRFDRISSDGYVSDIGSQGRRLRLDAAAEEAPDYADEPFREEVYYDNRWDQMDTGPFFSGSIRSPHGVTSKGIAIRLGDEGEAAMCFDTEMLRMSVGWRGNFLRTQPVRFGLIALPEVAGPLAWTGASAKTPGWSVDGEFEDPRPVPFGPIPEEHGRYDGLHLHGDRVVLSYQVRKTSVRESPWVERHAEVMAFTRTMEMENVADALSMIVCEGGNAAERREIDGVSMAVVEREAGAVAVAVVGHEAASLSTAGGRVLLDVPATEDTIRLKLLIFSGPADDLATFAALVRESGAPADLSPLVEPGPSRWGEPLVTEGVVSQRDEPYVIDTLTVPYDNPYNALMFIGGHDFLPNGDAAVCTAHGDVWLVSGIDDDLEQLTWKRFATGLFQPLGLKVVDGEIYVTGRDQITVLHDLNEDGEADYYENFNNHGQVTHNGHEYVTNLETDSEGWFYYTKADTNGATEHDGSLLRVSPDGSRLEVYATGFRNTNGMGIGPDDIITVSPNEGTWTPASHISVVQQGGFYGFVPSHHREQTPESYDPPLCFIPREVDNSSGSQVWAPREGWGPLSGHMLHLSFGRASWMLVLPQRVDDELWQGGVVELPGRFLSGVHRGRFNPHDGQLYVSGIQGWQTAAVRDGSLQRIRYTGGDVYVATGLAVGGTCIRLSFDEPLRRQFAENLESYAIEQWNYRWTSAYGSADWSVASPERQGRDPVAISSATLSEDGRSVCLEVESLEPVMQMSIRYNLEAADGNLVRGAVYNTINAVPDECPCER